MTLKGRRAVLQGKADIVENAFRVLDDIEAKGRDVFRSDELTYYAAKGALAEAIEATLDVANHLIAANGFRRANNYADLSGRLQDMAGFRNVLVHRYGELDPGRVWEVVEEDRHDIAEFFAVVFDAVET